MSAPYAVVKFRLRAEIGTGQDQFVLEDIVQYAASFEINSIPEGSLLVAVGKNVDTDLVATIHSKISQLKLQLPIKVYLRAIVPSKDLATAGVEALDAPKGVLIFDGYAVGTGWSRSTTAAQFTIHMVHWLVDLHYASAISASSHPANPGDWKYPASYGVNPNFTLTGGENPSQPGWVPMIHEDDVTAFDIRDDLWGNVLHQWMKRVASDDPAESLLQGGNSNLRPSDLVKSTLAALERLKPNPAGAKLSVDLPADSDNSVIVVEGLTMALLNESGTSWFNTTLWGKLVSEWGPAYAFAVIPRVDDGLIVPLAGGLQGAPWAVIGAEDYASCEANAQLHQVLRAVGLVHPLMDATSAAFLVDDRGGMAGWYQPEGLTQGMVLIKDAPGWLAQTLIASDYSVDTTGAAGTAVPTAADDTDEIDLAPPPPDPAKAQRAQRDILSKFAHQWYVQEMLKGRTGELAGKIRFDIAPGSNVKIEARGSRNFFHEQDDLAEDVFATVTRVSYVLNAEAQQGGTSFALAHIRTAAENIAEATSVAGPPLYTTVWRGASLLSVVVPEASEK